MLLQTRALLWRTVEEGQVAFLPAGAFALEGGCSAFHCPRLAHFAPTRLSENPRLQWLGHPTLGDIDS